MRATRLLTVFCLIGFTSSAFASLASEQELSTTATRSRSQPSISRWKLVPTLTGDSTLITFDNIPADLETRFDRRVGLGGGALIEYRNRHFSFQTGALFQRYSFEGKVTHKSASENTQSDSLLRARVDYLMIPLIAKVNMPINRTFAFSMKAGVSPSALLGVESLSEEALTDHNTGDVRFRNYHDQDPGALRAVNVIATGGAALEYNWAARWDLRFEALYSRTLLPINHTPESERNTYGEAIGGAMGIGFRI